jgi:hypothetical protein
VVLSLLGPEVPVVVGLMGGVKRQNHKGRQHDRETPAKRQTDDVIGGLRRQPDPPTPSAAN